MCERVRGGAQARAPFYPPPSLYRASMGRVIPGPEFILVFADGSPEVHKLAAVRRLVAHLGARPASIEQAARRDPDLGPVVSLVRGLALHHAELPAAEQDRGRNPVLPVPIAVLEAEDRHPRHHAGFTFGCHSLADYEGRVNEPNLRLSFAPKPF